MKIFVLFMASFAAIAATVQAPEGYEIAGSNRPCCTFAPSTFGFKTNTFDYIGIDTLDEHSFGREEWDNVGILYSCRAGFIDISHLRDNADWSAHIFSKLPKWLNSGKEILARNEGGFSKRSVYFPRSKNANTAALTLDDLEKIAVSITWNLALLHEIATGFPIPVSAPATLFIHEKVSAFSVEDAFSNLQGAWLGVKASRDILPFNQAMTKVLDSTMKSYQALTRDMTIKAFEAIENHWWLPSFLGTYRTVRRRDFTYDVEVVPHRIAGAPFCDVTESAKLEIPYQLSNGKTVHDYYSIKGVPTNRLKKKMRELGLELDHPIGQADYPKIIGALKQLFIEEIGPDILEDNWKLTPENPEELLVEHDDPHSL